MGGVKLTEFAHHIIHVNLHVLGAHPRMRVGFAGISVLGNIDRLHPLAHGGVRGVRILHELGKPAFQVQPVVEHQISIMRLLNIAGSRFILVNLGAGLGQRFDIQVITRNVFSDVRQHGEGGEHGLLFVLLPRRSAGAEQKHKDTGQGYPQHEKTARMCGTYSVSVRTVTVRSEYGCHDFAFLCCGCITLLTCRNRLRLIEASYLGVDHPR